MCGDEREIVRREVELRGDDVLGLLLGERQISVK